MERGQEKLEEDWVEWNAGTWVGDTLKLRWLTSKWRGPGSKWVKRVCSSWRSPMLEEHVEWKLPNIHFIEKKQKSQRSKYYGSKFSRYRNMTIFSYTDLISGFSSFPFSTKTTICTALKEEHQKWMSYMCVSLRNSQGDSERSCLWSGTLLVSHMDPQLHGWQTLLDSVSSPVLYPGLTGKVPTALTPCDYRAQSFSQNWLAHCLPLVREPEFLFLHQTPKHFY